MSRRRLGAALVAILASAAIGACKTHRAPNAAVPEPPPAEEAREKLPPEKTQTWGEPRPGTPTAPPRAAAEEPPPLGVFALVVSPDESVRTKHMVDPFVRALVSSGVFTVANDGRYPEEIGEPGVTEDGRTSDATRARIREVTGAKYIVLATVREIDDKPEANAHEATIILTEAESGFVAASARATGREANDAVESAAHRLAEDVRARRREGTLVGSGPR